MTHSKKVIEDSLINDPFSRSVHATVVEDHIYGFPVVMCRCERWTIMLNAEELMF